MTRGISQGSILSPIFFTMFIDDLLKDLSSSEQGLRVARYLFNNFAYADDVTLLAASVPGLQVLIDKCFAYAVKWRFSFGIAKTRCIIFGESILKQTPTWYLGPDVIVNTDFIDVLGVRFTAGLTGAAHVEKRVSAARCRAFSLLRDGMCHPGLPTDVKTYLWDTAVRPILIYGYHCVHLRPAEIQCAEKFQSNHVKRVLGLPKRSHHTRLLNALGIDSIAQNVKFLRCSLFNRIFIRDSPVRTLNCALLSKWIASGIRVQGTLLDSIISFGLSPAKLALSSWSRSLCPPVAPAAEDGIVDSLRGLLLSSGFNRAGSVEHSMVKLLTKAF